MSINFGTGVSRVLDPSQTSFLVTIWQQGKPPLDAELNLLQQIANEWNRQAILRGVPSGFLGNATNTEADFVTNPIWSNWFQFGQQKSGESQSITWAVVNGWLIPVTGTLTGTPPGSPDNTDTWNRVTLDPPPANTGDTRVDYVFLEAWMARIPPNPATTNKPAAASIYRYGNVEGGYSFLSDDSVDPALGFETTQRVQVQYRIRVVTGLVGLGGFPDGFDPSAVKAQGAATSPTSFTFTNMRQTLGDPGLWRAGDGTSNSLGTVDGYTYAIPLAAVFRRNTSPWDGDPSQNLNGGLNRNPTAVDRTGWKTFSTTPTLASNLSDAALSLTLTSATNIPLPLNAATPVYVQIGDEVISYQVITGTTMTILARGQYGTKAEAHYAGDTLKVLSGRPDGLFSDQVAKTDILDLRHVVNPNGFDNQTLLSQSFDKLVRGQLRANWKYSGGGPRGPFVFYEDKIGTSAALGVTKLDAADGLRMVFSDAAMTQKYSIVVKPSQNPHNPPPGTEPIGVSWDLGVNVTSTTCAVGGIWSPGDTFDISLSAFTNGLPGGDTDQVRFLNDTIPGVVEMRVDGYVVPLQQDLHFAVSPNKPTAVDPLTITLLPAFDTAWQGRNLYLVIHVQYGPGRGMSRRPDSIHSISHLAPVSSKVLTQIAELPAGNLPMRISYAPLWSQFRNEQSWGLLPSTAEGFADLGSKTLIMTPFRQITMPSNLIAMDGLHINVDYGNVKVPGASNGSSTGTTTFTDGFANFPLQGVTAGDSLVITAPADSAGIYKVVGAIAATTFVVDRPIPANVGLSYNIYSSQSLMPLNDLSGAAKWTTTDPLQVFSGTTAANPNTKNIYATVPRHLMPGWGEVKVPILYQTSAGGTFDRGINFGVLSTEGGAPPTKESNYTPYPSGLTYSRFSNVDLTSGGLTPQAYNTAYNYGGYGVAGMRLFTDSRNLGRQGLELPPFYGIARLFAVYEAADYKANGSSFDSSTRVFNGGGATNLLRQNFSGPTFWVEIDADGDSTFILNADTIDIRKSPNPIASFATGKYVIEANIFGFDRGCFDLTQSARIVLSDGRTAGQAGDTLNRANNLIYNWDGSITAGTVASISSPDLMVPGPLPIGAEVGITYSRQPYQGDAWGSQSSNQDTGYAAGPLSSSNLWQLVNTHLDQSALTRPNQKPLEVLASLSFSTTLGTGRLSGDAVAPDSLDFRSVGYEDADAFPPPTSFAPRPITKHGADLGGINVGSEYLGMTDRLPLGATFRDKDFRGDVAGLAGQAFEYGGKSIGTLMVSQAANKSIEQDELNLSTSTVSSGAAGDVVVHVDGEPGNYSLLTNFRTNRGGSLFVASGSHPGGEVGQFMDISGTPTTPSNILTGIAMLVRNQVTNIGVNEVSAGDELMMVIVTYGNRFNIPIFAESPLLAISTSGTGEGLAAADLYRIPGHPLVRDNERMEVDPNAFSLPLPLNLITGP